MKCSLLATGALSQRMSISAPTPGSISEKTAIRPVEVERPACFSWTFLPRIRSPSIAFSMSPLASVRACLQSIMGRPVFSRSSFTAEAVISAMETISLSQVGPFCRKGRMCDGPAKIQSSPAIWGTIVLPGRKDLLAAKQGGPSLRVPPRSCQQALEWWDSQARPTLRLPDKLAHVDAAAATASAGGSGRRLLALGPLLLRLAGLVLAGNHGVGQELHDQLDRANAVVIARNGQIDLVRIAIGVDQGDGRHAQLAGFLDRVSSLCGGRSPRGIPAGGSWFACR